MHPSTEMSPVLAIDGPRAHDSAETAAAAGYAGLRVRERGAAPVRRARRYKEVTWRRRHRVWCLGTTLHQTPPYPSDTTQIHTQHPVAYHVKPAARSTARCTASIPPDSPPPMRSATCAQGLTLVHFSAQLEPCLTLKNTLHTLHTLITRATQSLRLPPIPYTALKLS